MLNPVTVENVTMSPVDTSVDPQDGTILVELSMLATIPVVGAQPIPIAGTFHALGKVPGGSGLNFRGDSTPNRLFKLRQNPKIVTSTATDPDALGNVTIQLEIILHSKVPKRKWPYSQHDKMTKRIFTMENPPAKLSGQIDVVCMGGPCTGDGDTKLDITMQYQVQGSGLVQQLPAPRPRKPEDFK